jgi:hypothetical protein
MPKLKCIFLAIIPVIMGFLQTSAARSQDVQPCSGSELLPSASGGSDTDPASEIDLLTKQLLLKEIEVLKLNTRYRIEGRHESGV